VRVSVCVYVCVWCWCGHVCVLPQPVVFLKCRIVAPAQRLHSPYRPPGGQRPARRKDEITFCPGNFDLPLPFRSLSMLAVICTDNAPV